MKITVVLSFLFVTGAAFGQAAGTTSGMSAEPVIYEFQSHAGHASAQGMGQEQNLLMSSVNVQAHAAAKKADIVWNN